MSKTTWLYNLSFMMSENHNDIHLLCLKFRCCSNLSFLGFLLPLLFVLFVYIWHISPQFPATWIIRSVMRWLDYTSDHYCMVSWNLGRPYGCISVWHYFSDTWCWSLFFHSRKMLQIQNIQHTFYLLKLKELWYFCACSVYSLLGL